jgi:hypothetical protein
MYFRRVQATERAMAKDTNDIDRGASRKSGRGTVDPRTSQETGNSVCNVCIVTGYHYSYFNGLMSPMSENSCSYMNESGPSMS